MARLSNEHGPTSPWPFAITTVSTETCEPTSKGFHMQLFQHTPPRSLAYSLLVMLALLLTTSPVISLAADKGLKGWEEGSEYNGFYNSKELDRIKGEVVKFTEVTPLKGMAAGTALYLDEGDGEPILVHLCPVTYASSKETGIRRGIKTKIRGSWAFIDGKDVFLASKVKQGDHFSFKVRLTSDGTPFWTMSQEQLAKELASE